MKTQKIDQFKKETAMTLVEVVVTIGIIATTLLPLLAMMALSVDTQTESNEESVAMLISQSIFAELRKPVEIEGASSLLVRTSSVYDPTLVSGDPKSDPNIDYTTVPLSGTTEVIYGKKAPEDGVVYIDEGVIPLSDMVTDTGSYTNGSANENSTHMVAIKRTLIAGTTYYPDMYRVEVSIEAPAVASAINRKKYVYSSMMTLAY